MRYAARKQSDGTYHIVQSHFGLNWEIIRVGIRGCNVNRVIASLYAQSYFR